MSLVNLQELANFIPQELNKFGVSYIHMEIIYFNPTPRSGEFKFWMLFICVLLFHQEDMPIKCPWTFVQNIVLVSLGEELESKEIND